ncbi:hypothetical protein WBJ53_14695 [Spirosoma sp. SC4-14]
MNRLTATDRMPAENRQALLAVDSYWPLDEHREFAMRFIKANA